MHPDTQDPREFFRRFSILLLILWASVVFLVFLGRKSKKDQSAEKKAGPQDARPDIPWESRFTEADAVIRELVAELPPEIRAEAEKVPFLLKEWPPKDVSPRMGAYLSFQPAKVSTVPGPIIIYIGPHHDICARDNIDYSQEIRRTYLHELGHHLGLDEADLAEREIG